MLASRFGAKVVQRPPDLASDAATLDPVIAHAVHAGRGRGLALRCGGDRAADLTVGPAH
jgi:hypothetical protein